MLILNWFLCFYHYVWCFGLICEQWGVVYLFFQIGSCCSAFFHSSHKKMKAPCSNAHNFARFHLILILLTPSVRAIHALSVGYMCSNAHKSTRSFRILMSLTPSESAVHALSVGYMYIKIRQEHWKLRAFEHGAFNFSKMDFSFFPSPPPPPHI